METKNVVFDHEQENMFQACGLTEEMTDRTQELCLPLIKEGFKNDSKKSKIIEEVLLAIKSEMLNDDSPITEREMLIAISMYKVGGIVDNL
jgi:hypothetical protein